MAKDTVQAAVVRSSGRCVRSRLAEVRFVRRCGGPPRAVRFGLRAHVVHTNVRKALPLGSPVSRNINGLCPPSDQGGPIARKGPLPYVPLSGVAGPSPVGSGDAFGALPRCPGGAAFSGSANSWPVLGPVPPRGSRDRGAAPLAPASVASPPGSAPATGCFRLSASFRSAGSTRRTQTSAASPTLSTSSGSPGRHEGRCAVSSLGEPHRVWYPESKRGSATASPGQRSCPRTPESA
jgi:hypothetical protein